MVTAVLRDSGCEMGRVDAHDPGTVREHFYRDCTPSYDCLLFMYFCIDRTYEKHTVLCTVCISAASVQVTLPVALRRGLV